jgi:FixJ family two-component response regulator
MDALQSAQEQAASVFIVDQDTATRDALESLIRSMGWIVRTFASAEDFLLHHRILSPGCLVLDVAPPLLDGPAFREIAAARRLLPIVFVTAFRDIAMTVRAMKSGAVDFLTKPVDGGAILRAVECAVNRSQQALAHEASLRLLRARYDSLSGREREVMGLVVEGLLNKQIGADLGISEITVKAHRGKLMHKMAAKSLAELVQMAGRLRPAEAAAAPAAVQFSEARPAPARSVRCTTGTPDDSRAGRARRLHQCIGAASG